MSPRRVCPLCALREAAVVAPDCPVCTGHGVLDLGRAANSYDPATVSTAVHLALENAARRIDNTQDRSHDPRPDLARVLTQLARAGIIAPPKARAPHKPGPAAAPKTATPAALAYQATGRTPDTTDQHMIRAAPYPYRHGARPGVRGLPIFSAAGHPSSLARVGDPQPFDESTDDRTTARRAANYHARSLLYYAQRLRF